MQIIIAAAGWMCFSHLVGTRLGRRPLPGAILPMIWSSPPGWVWGVAELVAQDESLAIFDPYDILEISAFAAASEIKKAYFKKSKLFHPDKNPDPKAPEKFRRVAKAYEVRLARLARGRRASSTAVWAGTD